LTIGSRILPVLKHLQMGLTKSITKPMAKKIELATFYGAAYHFAFISREKSEIANHLGLSERTLYRYSKMPEWHRALDVYGYTGDRCFLKARTRDIERDTPDFEIVKQVYREAWIVCVPTHQLASYTARHTDVPEARIREWAKRYNWVKAFESEYNT